MNQRSNKKIILYDFLKVNGGAESVVVDMTEKLQDFDLCVGSIYPGYQFDNSSSHNKPNILTLGSPSNNPLWELVKSLWNFKYRTKFLYDYDLVIYSGSHTPTAIGNHYHGRNIYYCHTPPRYIYDLKKYYLKTLPWWKASALLLVIALTKSRYEKAVQHMDLIIANSENVKNRIQKYLGLSSVVLHPPCDTTLYKWHSQGDYYLSTARLEPYKQVDRIVKAFKLMPDKKLIIASGGSEQEKLKALAGKAGNISFTGWISKTTLQELIAKCIATIYIPKDEDFGLSPVESMAAGKPVIGIKEGGLLETVIPQQTGILINPDVTIKKLMAAVQTMSPEYALTFREPCEEQAQLFTPDVFFQKLQELII